MEAEKFPYQLVAFLDKEPAIGEPVYYGANGWYPQIALKRRFKAAGVSEDELIDKISKYCHTSHGLTIRTGELAQPERMPVKVLEVEADRDLIEFHKNFIEFMGDDMVSRYPERDGDNYLPHITAEYNGEMVIDDAKFSSRAIKIGRVCLLKDQIDENSQAFAYFDLR